jgi:hypothetical protein
MNGINSPEYLLRYSEPYGWFNIAFSRKAGIGWWYDVASIKMMRKVIYEHHWQS